MSAQAIMKLFDIKGPNSYKGILYNRKFITKEVEIQTANTKHQEQIKDLEEQ